MHLHIGELKNTDFKNPELILQDPSVTGHCKLTFVLNSGDDEGFFGPEVDINLIENVF